MTRFIIQILAMLLMTIDHVGMLLIPYGELYEIMRGIGRLAFPLFAFLIGEGYRHTKNIGKYLLRLFIFGFLIEAGAFIGQFIFGNTGHTELNIYLTLCIGLFITYLIRNKRIWVKFLAIIPLALVILTDRYITEVLIFNKYLGITFEYGLYGVLTILSFSLFDKKWIQILAFVLVNVLLVDPGILSLLKFNYLVTVYKSEYLTLLIIPIIILYNGKNGYRIPKWITYTYYPAHLFILFLLA